MIAFVNPLLCVGRGVEVADGAAVGSCVGAGVGELLGLATVDGEGDGAASGVVGAPAPREMVGAFVPLATAIAENAGFNVSVAETTPAAMVRKRMSEPPSQLGVAP